MVVLLVFELLHPVRMQRYAGSFFFHASTRACGHNQQFSCSHRTFIFFFYSCNWFRFFFRRCAELPLLLQFVFIAFSVRRETQSHSIKIEEGLFPFYIDTFDIHEYTCLQDFPQGCTSFLLFTNLQAFLLFFF